MPCAFVEQKIEPPVIYTIGCAQTTAEYFFERLRERGVQVVLDVRLKNNSQLSAFAKSPDIDYFIKALTGAKYIHDALLAPSEEILKAYRKKEIDWAEYEAQFNELMKQRNIDAHIIHRYIDASEQKYCLLCSEESAQHCHRRLVAQRMAAWFGLEIVHL